MGGDTKRGERREFEPPPWEKDQFEQLARRKAAESEAGSGETVAEESREAEVVESLPEAAPDADAPPLDTRVVDAMLVQLSGQEGSALKPVARASRGLAAGLAVIGSAMVIAGGVAAARVAGAGAGTVGALGAGMVVVFGGLIIGAAVWLWVRAGGVQGS